MLVFLVSMWQRPLCNTHVFAMNSVSLFCFTSEILHMLTSPPQFKPMPHLDTWAQFHRAAKHKNLLSMEFLPSIKQGLPTNVYMIFRISKQQLNTLVSSNMKQMKIRMVILFLSSYKLHAKQILVLTGFIKLGPVDSWDLTKSYSGISTSPGCA